MAPKSQHKTSIYLDTDVLGIIAQREVGAGTRSEVIRACVERYAEVCQRSCPAFTDAEWRFLFGVLDEECLAGRPSASYIVPAVKDKLERSGLPLGEKMRALVARLEQATFVELVAVLDEAERWWAAVRRGQKPRTRAEA